MIPEAEILRRAREWQTDPMAVELDYVLGCFLARWFRLPLAEDMVFKGGTCLRKCYFPDYRFSEDVDLTALREVDADELRGAIEAATAEVARSTGVDLAAQPPRIEIVGEGTASAFLEARVYFRGPLQRSGSPQGIRIDVTGSEVMTFEVVSRHLTHPYADAEDLRLDQVRIPCYDLREVLLEKLRGLAGQRRYAIARDLYDVHYLLTTAHLSLEELISRVPAKFGSIDLQLTRRTLKDFHDRRAEFELDWGRAVQRLVPSDDLVEFDAAWTTADEALSAIVDVHV